MLSLVVSQDNNNQKQDARRLSNVSFSSSTSEVSHFFVGAEELSTEINSDPPPPPAQPTAEATPAIAKEEAKSLPGKRKPLTRMDIGLPSNFVHLHHVSMGPASPPLNLKGDSKIIYATPKELLAEIRSGTKLRHIDLQVDRDCFVTGRDALMAEIRKGKELKSTKPISKLSISGPTNFVHLQHAGMDSINVHNVLPPPPPTPVAAPRSVKRIGPLVN